MTYEDKEEIPMNLVTVLGDGRMFIPAFRCKEYPYVERLLRRWRDEGLNYWRPAEGNLDGWVGPKPEGAA